MKSAKTVSLGVALVLSLAFTGCGGSSSHNSQPQKQEQKQEKKVEYAQADINTLLKEASENAARAKKNYNNKAVKIVGGYVSTIESGGAYISIGNGDQLSLMHVQCYPNSSKAKDAMIELNKGQAVVVYGTISDVGEIMGYSVKMDKIEAAQ